MDKKEQSSDLDGKSRDERCHKAFKSEKMKDTNFLFEERDKIIIYNAPKVLLTMCCPVFEQMFYGPVTLADNPDTVVVQIKDIRSNVFIKFLKLIYNPNLLPNLDIDDIDCHERSQFLVDLLYTSKKYMFKDLQNAVVKYINSSIETQNAYFYFQQGKLFAEIDSQTCWEVLLENGKEFIKDESFLDMKASDLLNLLLDDELVAEELDILKATMKWAEHNMAIEKLEITPVNIRQFLGEEIFYAIRYPLLNKEDLFDFTFKTKFLNMKEILNVLLPNLKLERQHGRVLKFCTIPRKPTGCYFYRKIVGDRLQERRIDFIFIQSTSSAPCSIRGLYVLPPEEHNFGIAVYDVSIQDLAYASISPKPSIYFPLLEVIFKKPIIVGQEKTVIGIKFSIDASFNHYVLSYHQALNPRSVIIEPVHMYPLICGVLI